MEAIKRAKEREARARQAIDQAGKTKKQSPGNEVATPEDPGRQKEEEPKTPTTRLRRKTSHGPASAETLKMGKSAEQLNTTDRACIARCSTAEQEIHAPSTNKKGYVIDTTIKQSKVPPGSSKDTKPKAKAKPKCIPEKKVSPEKRTKVNEKSLPAPKSTPKPLTIRSKGSAPPSAKKPPTVRSSGQPVANKNVKSPRKTIAKKSPKKVESKANKVPPKTKSPKKRSHVAKRPASQVEPEDENEETTPSRSDPGHDSDQAQEPEMDERETAKKKAHALYMRYWRSVNQSRNTPKQIKDLAKRFKYCVAEQQALFEDFMKTGGDWKKGMIWKSVVNKHRGVSTGVRKWLTRDQIVKHFDSEEIADAMVTRKRSKEELHAEIREHPELPGLEQFLILVEDSEVQEEEQEITDMFKMQERDQSSDDSSPSEDEETPKKKVPKSKKKGKKNKKKSKNKKAKKGSKEKAEDEDPEKEKNKETIRSAQKAISNLTKKIKVCNTRRDAASGWSANIRREIQKDLDKTVQALSDARSKLQTALEAGSKDYRLLADLSERATTTLEKADETMAPLTGKKRKATAGGD